MSRRGPRFLASLFSASVVLFAAPSARADDRAVRKSFDDIAAINTATDEKKVELVQEAIDRHGIPAVVKWLAADRTQAPFKGGLRLAIDGLVRQPGYVPRRETVRAIEAGPVGDALLEATENLWNEDVVEVALVRVLEGDRYWARADVNEIILVVGRRGSRKTVPTLTKILFEDSNIESQRSFNASVALRWIAARADNPDKVLEPVVTRLAGWNVTLLDVLERTRLRDILSVVGATRTSAVGLLGTIASKIEKGEPQRTETIAWVYDALAAMGSKPALDYLKSRFNGPAVEGEKNERERLLALAASFGNVRSEMWGLVIPDLVNFAEAKGRDAGLKAAIYKALEQMTGMKKKDAQEWLAFSKTLALPEAPAETPTGPDR